MGRRQTGSRRRHAHFERWLHVWRTLAAEHVPLMVLLFATILLLSGLVVYAIEWRTNPGFRSVGDGLWWALVTLTTIGYGDRYPVTTAGRLVAGVVVLVGVGMVGVITAKIASVLVERRIREGRGLSEAHDLEGHYVIMGWKPDMHLLVRDILSTQRGVGPERVMLVNTAGQEHNEGLREEYPGLRYLHGEVTDPLVLQRANITRAAKVFVLADAGEGRSDQEIDARTVMALMNIENQAPQVYTYAEVLDTQYVEYLRLARCDEIILCREYGRFILVSASASAGISQALLELMDIREGRGLTSQPIPRELVGRTFGELSAHFRSKGGGLVIGLLENTGQVLETKKKALREAQKTANVEQLVENLRKVRALVVNRPTLNPDDTYPISASARALVLPRSANGAGEAGR